MAPAALRIFNFRMSSGTERKSLVGLRDDLVGAAEFVEVVDVERPEIDLHRVENVLHADAELLRLRAVEVGEDLGRVDLVAA